MPEPIRVVGAVATRTLRVLWLLEELGLAYEHAPEPPRSEAVSALDPAGKVPLVVIDGNVLSDSTAILTYLADRHAACAYSSGTLERARQDAMTQFALDAIEGPLWTAAKHSFVLPKELRVPKVKAACHYDYSRGMEVLAGRLGDAPFAAGEMFTIADIVLGHCWRWAGAAKFPRPEGTAAAHAERVLARPALARALDRAGG